MALVAYSESDSDSEDDAPAPKRQRLHTKAEQESPPPLPASFHDLYSSTVRVSTTDDPSLHAGRKRLVKHVQGNWSAHVYLEWHPTPKDHETLSQLLAAVPDSSTVNSLLQTPLSVPLPLHISLSAPLVLRTETKDHFLATITEELTPILNTLRRPLTVNPAALSWHGNENSTRYFLVLRVANTPDDHQRGGDALALLNQLLRTSNRVAQEFGQPQLYTGTGASSRKAATKPSRQDDRARDGKQQQQQRDFSPYFHISVAWALPSPDLDLQDENLKMRPAVERVMEDVRSITVPFDAVKIRIGQTVTSLPFGTKQAQSRGAVLG